MKLHLNLSPFPHILYGPLVATLNCLFAKFLFPLYHISVGPNFCSS